MRLILIRHGEAAPVGAHGVHDDEERPLTDAGRGQCRAAAAALKRLGVKLDRLLASPLVRARQTAEEVVAGWGDGAPEVEECEALAPGGRKRKVNQKLLQDSVDTVAVVGHNPDLSEMVGWYLGDKAIGIDLDKGGMACIDFDGVPNKGGGTLAWLVGPDWYPVA
ncbi:MAG: phosphohistidine phosphatase SixA [Gemmataceae bacterium]